MLSAAKHRSRHAQMLRCAQHDRLMLILLVNIYWRKPPDYSTSRAISRWEERICTIRPQGRQRTSGPLFPLEPPQRIQQYSLDPPARL